MAHGARIDSVVIFVHGLDRSVTFYSDVLALKVTDQSSTAALLTSVSGAQLILRAVGSNAAHQLGGVGVQYVIWTAGDRAELERCEQALQRRGAHRDTRTSKQVTVVEGRDPDDLVVMMTYPGPDRVPLDELPVRIYGW